MNYSLLDLRTSLFSIRVPSLAAITQKKFSPPNLEVENFKGDFFHFKCFTSGNPLRSKFKCSEEGGETSANFYCLPNLCEKIDLYPSVLLGINEHD